MMGSPMSEPASLLLFSDLSVAPHEGVIGGVLSCLSV
ncbi:hypothetical protein ALP68_100935 [Pseudomonas ficuserectae]|uniref:Uncharacterized protein n=10 Tax=Pseudomonas syringae group TaxID=136849 RepID=A0A3M5LM13_PSESS|nr:hypothetical protein ALO90_101012 [Pseudomonas amygdali pv. aesculi]KPW31486.1 hypothetical protein ALO51_100920 [Pseudomonas amygdali]KPW48700.1 hypothetical protein ALO82_100949 [Pseudomonas syringae pv. broussonetiae]KPW74333.1 hypothetical protein ALO78_100853 [Pseudomonas amygdali pv. ciccaronei]KPW88390.1 hypothetical protein ALO50_101107 [Pseudomonas syringae pv. cerasicola]KPW93151.1 hypothetical protein ALO79_100139 [Pseudomonas syringae pv. castaneae]KPX04971.1 hypothetical prote